MGFRNTAIEFVNFFVQNGIAGIYQFWMTNAPVLPMLTAMTGLKYQFVVRTDKPIIEAMSISNSKSSILIAFTNYPYMI